MAQVTIDEKILKKNLRVMKRSKTILASAMVVLGVLILLWPDVTVNIMSQVVGALLCIGGLGCIVLFFVNKERNLVATGSLIAGVVLAVLGYWHFRNPLAIAELIPMMMGGLIVAGGVINVTEAIQIRKDGNDGFWISLAIAAVTIALGVLILCNPAFLSSVIVRIMGVVMIFDGASDIWLLSKISGVVKKVEKAVKEAVDTEALEVADENVAAVAEAEIAKKEEPADYDAQNTSTDFSWAEEPAAPAAEEPAEPEEPAEAPEAAEPMFDEPAEEEPAAEPAPEPASFWNEEPDISEQFPEAYKAASQELQEEAPAAQTYSWKEEAAAASETSFFDIEEESLPEEKEDAFGSDEPAFVYGGASEESIRTDDENKPAEDSDEDYSFQ